MRGFAGGMFDLGHGRKWPQNRHKEKTLLMNTRDHCQFHMPHLSNTQYTISWYRHIQIIQTVHNPLSHSFSIPFSPIFYSYRFHFYFNVFISIAFFITRIRQRDIVRFGQKENKKKEKAKKRQKK